MLLSLDSVILFYFGVLQILEKHPTSIKTFGILVKYQSQTGSNFRAFHLQQENQELKCRKLMILACRNRGT
jgi:hypothetical protein